MNGGIEGGGDELGCFCEEACKAMERLVMTKVREILRLRWALVPGCSRLTKNRGATEPLQALEKNS